MTDPLRFFHSSGPTPPTLRDGMTIKLEDTLYVLHGPDDHGLWTLERIG